MSENEKLQNKSPKSSSTTSKKTRKPKIEKVENTVAEEQGIQKPEVVYKWIKDEANGEKKCECCEAVMRGWAYRQNFNYCPMCGNRVV